MELNSECGIRNSELFMICGFIAKAKISYNGNYPYRTKRKSVLFIFLRNSGA